MTYRLAFVLAFSVVLLPAAALAATDQDKSAVADQAASAGRTPKTSERTTKPRGAKRAPAGYGFLPGYEPPPRDRFGGIVGTGPGYRYSWEGGRYWYRGRWYYGYGGPGFYRGQWNGGSIGPCYTQTPIGPMWNCGR